MSAWDEPKRELARIDRADIGEVYNGMLGLIVGFKYGKAGYQGMSDYIIEAGLIVRFMRAIGVMHLSKAEGVSCWVTHTHREILKIEPLHEEDGRPLVIAEWQEWVKRRMPAISWHELETGEAP